MPVAQGGPPPLRQMLMIGLGVVMTLGTILFIVTSTGNLLGNQSSLQIDAGEPVFNIGPAEDRAGDIARQGPQFLPDPTGGDREVWVNHVGDDEATGWHAFRVRPLASPRTCIAEWQATAAQFVDSCDGTVYPATGEGLPQVPVTVTTEGEVSIRLDTIAGSDASVTDSSATNG